MSEERLRDPKDVIIRDTTLAEILEKHRHWLNNKKYFDDTYSEERANLSNLDLKYINFYNFDLRYIDFSSSDLSGSGFIVSDCKYAIFDQTTLDDANFNGVHADYASFRYAKASKVFFSGAHLEYTNFDFVKFNQCDFSASYLTGASFNDSYLKKANFAYSALTDALFHRTNINGANFMHVSTFRAQFVYSDIRNTKFNNANINYTSFIRCQIPFANFKDVSTDEYTTFRENDGSYENTNMPDLPMICPEEGSFIGYKIGTYDDFTRERFLIKLEILADAKRLCGDTRICRCNKAKVLDIIDIETNEHVNMCYSFFDFTFKYIVGEIAEVDEFDDFRFYNNIIYI